MDTDTMVGQAAGWFRDPAPRDPLAPDTWRYWDGRAWTAQTRTGTKRQRREWREQAAAEQQAYRQDLLERAQYGDEDAHWQLMALSGHPKTGRPPSAGPTVDGERLAGWWVRVGATTVDSCLVSMLGCLVSWPFLSQVVTTMNRWLEAVSRAQRHGSPVPSRTTLLDELGAPFLLAVLLFAAVAAVYEVGFLRTLRATPGKLLLGLRVRNEHVEGPLSWRAALLRWAGKTGVGLAQLVPFGILVVGVYTVLDYLWPLGDRRRQALHDKLGRTLVVVCRG